MAVDEVNAKGGVLGKKLEVISRDDGGNPGDAVRAADELVTREGVSMIAGTFLSHIGWRSPISPARKSALPRSRTTHRQDHWQNSNRYTYRLRA
jgi:branched-chain amino acid transport system substrate-binding protein